MILWLRVRRFRTSVFTALAVAILLVPGDRLALPVPNVFGGSALAIPLAALLPLAVGVAVAFGMSSGNPTLETVASRPIRLLDIAYTLVIALFALLFCTLAGAFGGAIHAFAAGRNVLGYVGLTLVGFRTLGLNAATVLPASFAILAALFGTGPNRQSQRWAWPLAPNNDPIAFLLAIGLFLLGTTLLLRAATLSED